ncbi:hypothetical protein [Roseobacter sp. CCS2]|uniref:hypothetical protein n=1 Tax=Roseobacter sp. CCS2 TaxID=391593 RepID=UPI0000F3E608|nr:hypothetical protein [Roseobacter sp. CCS2]EBA11062.1 hypothetical protein RCCS2_01234 [Roseobacter sp. CCS2]
MADSYVQTVAGELADLTLADARMSGDDHIVDTIGEILGASSQTLQEAFLTAVRVRRAEARARELLTQRSGKFKVGSHMITDGHQTFDAEAVDGDAIEMPASASEPAQATEPQTEEDAAFADVLNTLDEFLQTDAPADDEPKPISPQKPSRR